MLHKVSLLWPNWLGALSSFLAPYFLFLITVHILQFDSALAIEAKGRIYNHHLQMTPTPELGLPNISIHHAGNTHLKPKYFVKTI